MLYIHHKKSKDHFKLKGPSSFVLKVNVAEFTRLKQQFKRRLKEAQIQGDDAKKTTNEVKNQDLEI